MVSFFKNMVRKIKLQLFGNMLKKCTGKTEESRVHKFGTKKGEQWKKKKKKKQAGNHTLEDEETEEDEEQEEVRAETLKRERFGQRF